MKKLPPRFRALTRRTLGMQAAPAIAPAALHALAAAEDVLVIAIGALTPGAIDPALPGEQRAAALTSLAASVAGVPRERAIVLHCG